MVEKSKSQPEATTAAGDAVSSGAAIPPANGQNSENEELDKHEKLGDENIDAIMVEIEEDSNGETEHFLSYFFYSIRCCLFCSALRM